MNQDLSGKLEDYLEAMLELEEEDRPARVKDISQALSVHKSTVTSALRNLSEKGLVNYHPYEIARLTPKGRKIAREVTRHHKVIRRFLKEVLFLDDETAEQNACRMEHVVDQEVLERLTYFARFIESCPRAGKDWLSNFDEFARNGGRISRDKTKLNRFIKGFESKVPNEQEEGEDE
jgi:DtxR family Mn-dependent transcriptional regulator